MDEKKTAEKPQEVNFSATNFAILIGMVVCLHFSFGLQVVCLLWANIPRARSIGGVFALLQTHHQQTKTPTGQTHHQHTGQVVCLHRTDKKVLGILLI